MKKKMIRVIAVLLSIILVVPIQSTAADERSSEYIDMITSNLTPLSAGEVQVYFIVNAKNIYNSVGALSITILESQDNSVWRIYATYSNTDYPQMIGSNTSCHSYRLTCQGIIGRYYQERIAVYVGNGSNSDTRYVYTNTIKAVASV